LATVQVFGRFNGRVSGPGKLSAPRNAFWEMPPKSWCAANIPTTYRSQKVDNAGGQWKGFSFSQERALDLNRS